MDSICQVKISAKVVYIHFIIFFGKIFVLSAGFGICWPTQDAVWKTCQEQWMIGMDRERESEKSVLAVQPDDDDDDDPLTEM